MAEERVRSRHVYGVWRRKRLHTSPRRFPFSTCCVFIRACDMLDLSSFFAQLTQYFLRNNSHVSLAHLDRTGASTHNCMFVTKEGKAPGTCTYARVCACARMLECFHNHYLTCQTMPCLSSGNLAIMLPIIILICDK
jgi:hypothetical protein